MITFKLLLKLLFIKFDFFLIFLLDIFYLHFKCYPLSSTQPPTPPLLSALRFTYTGEVQAGLTVSPPFGAQQGHPLLHMQPEPWVSPYVLFGWWFSPWELWLLHIVVLTGLQAPSGPSILSLTPTMGTPFSVQWLAVSICLCICHALAEPLKRQLYQAPVSMHFLASAILSGFGGCMYMNWIPRWGRLWMAIPSVSAPNFVSISPPRNILVPLSKKDWSIQTLVILLLELHVVCGLYPG